MSDNPILDEMVFDESSGMLLYKGVRYLLIRPETIAGFQRAVGEWAGKEAEEKLFEGGVQGGYLSSKKYKEVYGFSEQEILDFMIKMGSQIGWGRFKLDVYDPKLKLLRVTVENSPFAQAYGESVDGVCHLIRGVLAGMSAYLFGETCTAKETECLAKGDKKCLFEIITESLTEQREYLKGKKILIVDDEPDILEILSEELYECSVSTAPDFETAQSLLEQQTYDGAILDIMGVRGYDILAIAIKKGIPTLMLTAHALSPDDLVKSIESGAGAYVPKERISEIPSFLKEIMVAHKKGERGLGNWFIRLAEFFDERFGEDWKKPYDPDFWKKIKYT